MTRPRLHTGDALRIRGERWTVAHESVHGTTSILAVRGAERANSGQVARFLLPFEPIERIQPAAAPRIVRPAAWRARARAALASATPSVDSLRSAARGSFDLLPYQLEPALAVTRGLAARVLIADDVGLGKTIQAGLIVAEVLDRTPDARVLVLCPAALMRQWRDELHDRFALTATVLDSDGLARTASCFDRAANPWAAEPLVIASVDFVKRPEVLRALEGLVWDVLVLDEAHNLATRSDRSAAATALASRARTVVTLSATPHSGDESAFARLCSLGDPHGRFPLAVFRRSRAEVGNPAGRRMRWLYIRATPAETAMHAALDDYARRVWQARDAERGGRLAVAVLLKRAASSAGALTRSVDRRLALLSAAPGSSSWQPALPFEAADDDDEPGAALAIPALADGREERRHLERVLALGHAAAACESKLKALTRWLRRVDQPVLIFTEFRDTLAQVRRTLVDAGFPPERIAELHGGLTRRERHASEAAFTRGAATLLLATDAASEGLNLHRRCRCVINLECPWNPVRLEQRIGRVDRIGQRQRVHAIQLVAAGSFEPRVLEHMRDRAARAMTALLAPPADVAIADAVLGGLDLPLSGTAAPPEFLHRLDLRDAAVLEADRIARSRAIAVRSTATSNRPVASVVRGPGRSVWAFEIVLTDADGLPVWTTVVGGEGDALPPASARDARVIVRAGAGRLRELLAVVAVRLAGTTAAALQPVAALAAGREAAIASAIRLRHARIAADLLQPGLFDRSAERRAAAQARVLEEALARCHTRLESVSRLAHIGIAEEPVLRFALLRR